MPTSLSSKQLNIIHAEDDMEIHESCRRDILDMFQKYALPSPNMIHTRYGNAIYRLIEDMRKGGETCDILLMDLNLLDKDDLDGLRIVQKISEFSPHTRIVVLSGWIYDGDYKSKLEEYKEKGIISAYFHTSAHEEWCGYLMELIRKKNVGLLQFSDIHVSCDENDRTEQILSDFADSFHERADLLIFSGDISNRAKVEEFQKAEKLLKRFCSDLGVQRCVFVPGNHDIKRESPVMSAFYNFLAFQRTMAEFLPEAEVDEIVSHADSAEYADYICTVTVLPTLRTIVAGLNSAATIRDPKFRYSYGEVTANQLKLFEERLQEKKRSYPNYLTICTMHHNIFEPSQYFDLRNTEESIQWVPPVKNQGLILSKCLANDVNILMTGHSHLSTVYTLNAYEKEHGVPLHLISTGVLSGRGVLPLEPHLTVNYLTYAIDMAGNISEMKLTPYRLYLKDGNWEKQREISLMV